MVRNEQKRAALETLLRDKQMQRAIIFTRTKHGANKVSRQLNASGFVAEVIHGNKTQAARQRALQNFKQGDAWILVATDIAARGIDVDQVSHVINYELPHEPESYVHRIGRTGRAGANGVAWALIDPSEKPRLRGIERLIKRNLEPLELDLPKNPQQPDAVLSGDNKSDTAQQKPHSNKKASAQGRKRPTQKIRNNKKPGKPSREQRGNEHNDNSGPTTSTRAEDGQSAPSKKRRKRRSKPNTRQQPHDRQSTQNNGKGDDQGGERTPRRRRRNAA